MCKGIFGKLNIHFSINIKIFKRTNNLPEEKKFTA